MRKRATLLLAAVMVTALAGCSGSTDFWGNPDPSPTNTEITIDDVCAAPEADSVQGQFDPATGQGRPGDVRPGNSWIVVGIQVHAAAEEDITHRVVQACVPIDVHVYNRTREADAALLNHIGVEPGPFDFKTTTPFVGRYMAAQYDPTDERFAGRPPTYEFHVEARYAVERDVFTSQRPIAIRCAITINGATIVSSLSTLKAAEGGLVQCVFTGNEHWNHY